MIKAIYFGFAIILLLFNSTTSFTYAGDRPFRGPWNPEGLQQREKLSDKAIEASESFSYVQTILLNSLLFFQKKISPADGDRCPMYPSCSQYALDSIKIHGFFIGTIMATARLTQERGEMKTAPKILIHNSLLFYDPVENNDFWFDNEKKASQIR